MGALLIIWLVSIPIFLAIWCLPVPKFLDLITNNWERWWSMPLFVGGGTAYGMLLSCTPLLDYFWRDAIIER